MAATIRQAKETVGAGGSQSDLPLALIGQEGGANNPLGVSPAPSPRELGESGDGATLRETALRYARAARAAGAAALLGPRLDLATDMNENANLCFGASSDQVSGAGIAFARAAAEGGVLPIVMHYPGTGTAVRTASGPPIVAETNVEALTDIMLPFANAAAEQLPGVLVGCVTVPTLDKTQTGRPACASPVMVQGILRDKWAYQGVVLADVSQPDLAAPTALDVFVTNCLAAGCDAVLLGQVSPAEFEQICRTLAVALRDGALSTDRMAASRARLASWSLALKMEMPASEKKTAEPQAPSPAETPAVKPTPPPITDVAPPAPQPAAAPEPVPAPTPSPVTTPEPSSGLVEHTIAPGETLEGIAKKYGVPAAEIVKLNNLKNTNNIQAGAKLKIPSSATTEAPKPPVTQEPAPTAAPPVTQEAVPVPEPPASPATPAETPKAEETPEKAVPKAPSPAETKADETKPENVPAPAQPENPTVPESKPEPKPEPSPESEPKQAPEITTVEAAPAPSPASTEPAPAAEPEKTPAAPEEKPAKSPHEAEKTSASEDEGQYEYHVVQPGENLYRLAINSGTTKEELMRLNDIKDPSLVKIGAKLKVPKKKQ